ncbi:MAG: hypothetical protein ABS76_14330 [Pelagibacterium sp. SCN 64-44]|nr:MAG: hypothetical protein ABS76_14330 [Pelagibacterium sp. SCN 64-44]
MHDVALLMYSEVGVSPPIAVNPPIWTERRLLMLAHIMQLVLSMIAANVTTGAVHAWSDMTLVPASGWQVHAMSLGFSHHPFVGLLIMKVDKPWLIDDA